MAGGILWHLAAALVCAWLGFLYVRRKARTEEIEDAVLALLARPSDAPAPPSALVRRALRFCEAEYEDVLGKPVRLESPEPQEAARAVADLLGRLARVRNAGTLGEGESPFAPLEAVGGLEANVTDASESGAMGSNGAVSENARDRKARWNGARWTQKESA